MFSDLGVLPEPVPPAAGSALDLVLARFHLYLLNERGLVSSTADAYGSNVVHLTARADERTGWVIVISAIDNLVKGGSGQAIQAANVALGLPETAGLPLVGLSP